MRITRNSGAASQACDSSVKDASGGGKECASLHQVNLTNNAAAEKKSIVKTEVAPPPILQSQLRHTGKSQVEAIELVDSDDESQSYDSRRMRNAPIPPTLLLLKMSVRSHPHTGVHLCGPDFSYTCTSTYITFGYMGLQAREDSDLTTVIVRDTVPLAGHVIPPWTAVLNRWTNELHMLGVTRE